MECWREKNNDRHINNYATLVFSRQVGIHLPGKKFCDGIQPDTRNTAWDVAMWAGIALRWSTSRDASQARC